MAGTIKDIAQKTGLGLATISKYLNGGHVLDKNRIAIERAIRELDYHVNSFARGLKTSRSKTIGVVIPELRSEFCTGIITIAEDILRKSGYGVLVCDCRTDDALECEAVKFLVNRMVDGIINMPVSGRGEHLEIPLAKDIPVVLLDRLIEGVRADAVLLDNRDAACRAMGMLLSAGHRRIGIVCGDRSVYTTGRRLAGYGEALAGYGLSVEESLTEYGEYTVQGGYDAMKRLLAANREMTAAFVTNYDMTLGAVMALNEAGIRVPEDLSFIGFDNVQVAQVVKPPLTIVVQPIAKIAETAAEILLSRLAGGGGRAPQIVRLKAEILGGRSVTSPA